MWILILLLMCSVANADVYIINKPDGAVYSISPENDAVMPEGYTKTVLKGQKVDDLNIDKDVTLYDLKNGKLNVNSKRALKRQKDDIDMAAYVEKRNNDKQSAVGKLKALGLTDDELKAILK